MCINVVRYDGQKSAQSIQEELQKTEDKYLKENFYIRDSVANLKDAVIKTSVGVTIHLLFDTWGNALMYAYLYRSWTNCALWIIISSSSER